MRLHVSKLLSILLIIFYVISIITNFSLAAYTVPFDGKIAGEAQGVKTNIEQVLSAILEAVRIAGIAIALIILIVIGIKIMMAAPGERANIKQYAMNYVIGAFIMVVAVGILTIVKEFADKAIKTS